MFDVGGGEFLFIVMLGIIVIGPKELPRAIKAVSSFVRRMREISSDFQLSLEEVAKDADLKKVSEELGSITDPIVTPEGLKENFENKIDPDGILGEALKEDAYPEVVETDFNEDNDLPTKKISVETLDLQKGEMDKEENNKSLIQENRK